jgi:hypothetical protein
LLTFVLPAANATEEPNPVVGILCCARTQLENRCISFVHGAARRWENRPLVQGTAKIEAATHKSQTFQT